MKKPSSLAQQVRQAQREVSGWSVERKLGVRLQGNSTLLTQYAPSPTPHTTKTDARRK